MGQQISVREFAPASSSSSIVNQAAPAGYRRALGHSEHRIHRKRRGPHRPQHEMQIQAGDPSIIYRVASCALTALLRGVLPPGTGPSTKGR